MKCSLTITLVFPLAAALFSPAQEGYSSPKSSKTTSSKSLQAGTELRASIAQPSPAPPAGDDFVIGNGDVLAINIWKEPEVSRTLPVRPDGKVTLPLVGDIQASGLTAAQLRANLERAFGNYITDPPVSVIVQEVRSQTFNILGNVQHPGAYALTKPTTVLDAIALASGLREWAKQTKIYVLRPGAHGTQQRLLFNYKQVTKGENLAQNLQLKSGDTVIVP